MVNLRLRRKIHSTHVDKIRQPARIAGRNALTEGNPHAPAGRRSPLRRTALFLDLPQRSARIPRIGKTFPITVSDAGILRRGAAPSAAPIGQRAGAPILAGAEADGEADGEVDGEADGEAGGADAGRIVSCHSHSAASAFTRYGSSAGARCR